MKLEICDICGEAEAIVGPLSGGKVFIRGSKGTADELLIHICRPCAYIIRQRQALCKEAFEKIIQEERK